MDLETTDPATVEAALVTSKGTMVATFFPEQAPRHVKSFLKLAQDGYYDGTAFHRIVRNFMIQGGCPNTKEGANGVPGTCLLYTSPSPRDQRGSRMPSSA